MLMMKQKDHERVRRALLYTFCLTITKAHTDDCLPHSHACGILLPSIRINKEPSSFTPNTGMSIDMDEAIVSLRILGILQAAVTSNGCDESSGQSQ